MLSEELRRELFEFRKAREWEQFHSARNLVTAISVEAAELLEYFRWTSDEDAKAVAAARRAELSDEIADLLILLTYLTADLGVDPEQAVRSKLAANAQKYPVEKSRGSSKKYSEL